MIDRSDSLIIVIDNAKKKMLSLKFKIKDGKLYAFNFFLPAENRKIIEVSKINGVSVATFLEKIEVNDLLNIDKMLNLGIDTTNHFICTLMDEEKNIDFDILSVDSKDDIFYKKHEINNIVSNISDEKIDKTVKTDNTMLEYASTNVKYLLNTIKNMSISKKDKSMLNSILQKFVLVDNNYINVGNNLDMIFLSTQLLMLDDNLDFIPKYVEDIMKRVMIFDYGDDLIEESNSAILTEGKIDYQKIIKMIRNCVAHSNYKVLENGKIEFYNRGKNKMNFTINKNDLSSLFDMLYNYYFLKGKFPVILYDNIYDIFPFTKKELFSYLLSIEVLGTNLLKLKKFESPEEQIIMDENLGYDIYDFNMDKNYSKKYDKERLKGRYERYLKKHLCSNSLLYSKKLSEEDIIYIISNVNEMGIDYFYKLSKPTQINIIHQLICKLYNKDYYFHNFIQNVVNYSNFDNVELMKNSYDYIKYKTKMELLIISLINNLLLFCYNQNKSSIKTDGLRFPETVYRDYLKSKIDLFYDASEELSALQFIYTSLLKVSSTHLVDYNDLRNVEENIKKTSNKLIKIKACISSANAILDEIANIQDYNNINIEILNRIRDCLAHGNLNISITNINDIMSTELKIIDKYEGKVQFQTIISFEDLIKILNDADFAKSLLNDNQNLNIK